MSQTMKANQAATSYRQTSVTVAPLTAVVMLYDGAIVRLQRAVVALEAKRLDESYNHVSCATVILRGLSHVLDFERGGALAYRLRDMYTMNILALLRAVGKPDAAARYRKISDGLVELRNAWVIVAKQPPEALRIGARPPSSVARR